MEITKIIKRNKNLEDFDVSKITNAIIKAMRSVDYDELQDAETIAQKVVSFLEEKKDSDEKYTPSVEEVQDIVEEQLMDFGLHEVARSYILYRNQRKELRELSAQMDISLIDNYLNKSDWKIKENSNMGYSLQGLNNHIAAEISKKYWLNKIYPSEIREAHVNGDFHIHDLSLISVYCVGWDLMDLLVHGFTGARGKLSCTPPKHLNTALGQAVNFLYTLQGEAAGAQAFSSFDTLLAPFVRYDNLSYKEVKQAMQSFVYNLNVPTRVGFQTPFTNITLDFVVPKIYKDMPVIIGGKPQRETYGEFQKEMDMINKAFLEVMREGDASGRVFTFPIPTYNLTEDFDWDNENLGILWEVTAKYGIPYFANFINSDMDAEDARSMCCRLRIDNRELRKRGGGLFGANPLTGSIGVVTLNMPRIGKKAHSELELSMEIDRLMDLAKNSLEIKRKLLEKLTDDGLYPYTTFYLKSIKDQFGKYWVNHFSTIGLVGMNEMMMNFLGKDIGSEEGKALSEKILDHMRDRLMQYQDETGNNYNLEATPAEGTSYRLARIDQKQFEDMIFANGQGADIVDPFYTNSTHLPVNYTDDIFEILEKQDKLQTKYTGGTVIHFFIGEQIKDPNVVKNLVRKIAENNELPYFSITPTFSICKTHGYLQGEHYTCPECNETCEVYSRVVGYLRPVEQWNDGKQAEYAMRKQVPEKGLKKVC